ncbi:MAG: hypothetical protein ACRCXD_05915 [Luteolibacter sp.]
MKKIQVALIVLIPLLGFSLLPPDVISHFDTSGTADTTLPRVACILLFTAISSILTFGPGFIAKGFGPSFDRRVPRFLKAYGLCFGVWALLFWILIIIANTIGHGNLSTVGVWLIGSVLLIPISIFLIPESNSKGRAEQDSMRRQ